MRRIATAALVFLGVLGAAGCGSASGGGATSITVTVTQLQGGTWVPYPDVEVKESADVIGTTNPPTIVGLITSARTNASGQVTFGVPGSTSTGNVCVSVYLTAPGSSSFGSECWSLNTVPSTVSLPMY